MAIAPSPALRLTSPIAVENSLGHWHCPYHLPGQEAYPIKIKKKTEEHQML